MRTILTLIILCFAYNSYGARASQDTITTNKTLLINFKNELKKFKDSINEITYPLVFSKEYSKLNSEVIIENTDNLDKLYKLSRSNLEPINNRNYQIETYGSISRGITVGNNQNSVLNSELDLQISGDLSENVSIKASIQDSNIPLQNNGYSQQIDEFDQIFIEIASDNWRIRGGDIDLIQNETLFGNFEKRIQGLAINAKIDNSIYAEAAGAIVKGKYKKTQITPQNGNQGPYKLIGQNGELFVLIVSDSESVFVNGKKLERGIDKDYVINYNAGEVIFNSTFPIMADMRIQVDYQVNEKNFNSFIGYTNFQIKNNNFTHYISFYNENDIKDQPLLQNISSDQIEVLSNAGDNVDLMNVPTGVLATFSENRILYRKEILNNEYIYVYSNNEEDELYDVNFSNVGNNQGDYVLVANNAIDNIFEYVPRINDEKQGNFDPIVKLIAPEKLQMLVYKSTYEAENNSRLNVELATSKKDENLFSKIDDSNNEGFASRVSYENEFKKNDYTLNALFNVNYLDNNFQPIQRIYNTEFNRDWDLNEVELRNYNQLFTDTRLELANKRIGRITYKFESLRYDDFYRGSKNSISVNTIEDKKLVFNSTSSIMNSRQQDYVSDFITTNNILNFKYEGGWATLVYNLERKKSDIPIINILNPDFGQEIYELKKGFGKKEKSFIELGYVRKKNDSILDNSLQNFSTYNSYFLNSQLLNKRKTKLNIFINKNEVISNNNAEKENFLNTRIIYNQRIFKDVIDSNLFFETNSGNLPQQEYTFLEVEPGLGNYTWIDINDNNIQELEEFEIAVFEDEGRYIRVLLPNQIFIKTYQNKFNYSLKLNFLSWKNSNNNFRKFISKFSNQFQYSVDKKTNLDINPEIEINPFQIDENGLLAYNYSLKNVFYFNKAKQNYSFVFTYSDNKSKNDFSFGSTRNSNNLKKLNFIHQLDDLFLFEIMGNKNKKSSWSENYEDKNFKLDEYTISPKLTYLTAENNRIDFKYKTFSSTNSIGNNESLKQQNFGISLFLNEKERRGLVSEFNYYKNQFKGSSNSVISYVMMNGLQDGENYTWSFRLQRKLSKLLDINFVYLGRKGDNNRTIHNGSVQLKAIF